VCYKAAEAMMVTKINEAFVSNAVWGHQRVCNWLAKITGAPSINDITSFPDILNLPFSCHHFFSTLQYLFYLNI
jgi:hypothetical protein